MKFEGFKLWYKGKLLSGDISSRKEAKGFRDAKELLSDVRILYVAPFLLTYMQIPSSKIVRKTHIRSSDHSLKIPSILVTNFNFF